jgi:23S rRNA U2552 (ribose-2'-O)-methylase RlmE/FtsJ
MANNEVFTPREYIEKLDKKFNLITGPVVDDCCGHGVWLKYAQDKGFPVWGCDVVPTNCIETIKLLYGDGDVQYLTGDKIPNIMKSPGLKGVFTHNGLVVPNIVCADSLKYRMNFNAQVASETFGNGLFEIE